MYKVTNELLVPLGVSSILVFTFLALSLSYVLPTAIAQVNDTVTVNVTVQGVSEITVVPSSLTFVVSPGQTDGPSFLDLQNTGSLNVSNLYAYVDTLEDEAVRPYGTTSSTSYAAGGVLTIQNETNPDVYFLGRLEWNATSDVSNMVKTGVSSPASWGFFRNSSFEYNWLIGNGTPAAGQPLGIYCNGTGTQFALEDDIDNGTANTRTPDSTNITRNGGDAQWSYFSVNRFNSSLEGACVATYWDCSKLYIYAYDRRTGYDTCSNSRYLQEDNLIPGEVHSINISAYLPFGIPASPGSMNISTLTVTGS